MTSFWRDDVIIGIWQTVWMPCANYMTNFSPGWSFSQGAKFAAAISCHWKHSHFSDRVEIPFRLHRFFQEPMKPCPCNRQLRNDLFRKPARYLSPHNRAAISAWAEIFWSSCLCLRFWKLGFTHHRLTGIKSLFTWIKVVPGRRLTTPPPTSHL